MSGRLTQEQAAIITASTGVLCGDFHTFHQYAERVVGRPIWTHEMATAEMWERIKAAGRADFLSIVPEGVAAAQNVTVEVKL